METFRLISQCRICSSANLTNVLRFQEQYLSPTFVKTNEGNPLARIKVPMTLALCGECGLLQLRETVHPDLLYRQYFYRSSTSGTMRVDLLDVVTDVLGKMRTREGDVVVDIGANDGLMLSYFPAPLRRIGVEPAKNIGWNGLDRSITVVNDYFTKASVQQVLGPSKVTIFTACAMFYDLDDPNSFVADIKELLDRDGVWCIQLSYLGSMIKNMNFYDICNEHLEYYSLAVLETLMRRHGLTVFDASLNAVNGGSARVFVTHAESGRPKSEALLQLLRREEQMHLRDPETYHRFSKDIQSLSNKVTTYVRKTLDDGKLVLALGASTKGNMLLQHLGIDKHMVPFISERNPEKVGLRSLGIDMELISETAARALKPACMLVLPWYFKEEIVKRERAYLDAGGVLLFPMPKPHVVRGEGEKPL